jgi:LysM repeat protein
MAAFPRARRLGLKAPMLVIASLLALPLIACGGDDPLPTPTATFPAALPTQPALLENTPEPASTTEVNGAQEYTVQAGDTLGAIATQFGVTVEAIVEANDIANPDLIQPGDTITIPTPQ